MKAEHRKELETNILADRMGRLVERMKHRPQRRAVFWVVLGLVVLVAAVVSYRLRVGSQQENMDRWVMLEDGRPQFLERLSGIEEEKQPSGATRLILSSAPDPSNAGKAARFQMARFFLWDQGIRILGSPNVKMGMDSIRFAEDIYNTLLKDCEGEPEFEAEARYGLAVIDETRALQNQDRLGTAERQFEEIASKYKESGFGPLAEKRAKQLKENREAISKLYRDLQTRFRIADEKTERLAPALP